MSIWLASSDSPTRAGTALLQPGFGLSLACLAKLRGVCRGRREAEKKEELSQLALGCLVCDGPESCPLSCPLQSSSPFQAASQSWVNQERPNLGCIKKPRIWPH